MTSTIARSEVTIPPPQQHTFMGMRIVVDRSLDDLPRMTVNSRFAELMPPEFVADLNKWMVEFFGRENRTYCLHRETLVVGPKTYAALLTIGGKAC